MQEESDVGSLPGREVQSPAFLFLSKMSCEETGEESEGDEPRHAMPRLLQGAIIDIGYWVGKEK